MEFWIFRLNALFEDHPYFDNGRVSVDYCKNANCVLVKVITKTSVISIEGLTEYGLIQEIWKEVFRLYDES